MVRISRPNPGPLIICIRFLRFGSAVRSCLSDNELSSHTINNQSAKMIKARAVKKANLEIMNTAASAPRTALQSSACSLS